MSDKDRVLQPTYGFSIGREYAYTVDCCLKLKSENLLLPSVMIESAQHIGLVVSVGINSQLGFSSAMLEYVTRNFCN